MFAQSLPITRLLAAAVLLVTSACSRGSAIDADANPPEPPASRTMRPSVTYLHLLRHTPFFTDLNTEQLRWVIDHSQEWEAKSGQVVDSSQHTASEAGYWILLDGGWELRYRGGIYPSGHADAGKWFNSTQLGRHDFQLVANEHSYVMHISDLAMDEMLAKGFRFQPHLEAGHALYHGL